MRKTALVCVVTGVVVAALLAAAVVAVAQPRPRQPRLRPGDAPRIARPEAGKLQLTMNLDGGMTVEKLAAQMPKSLPYYKASVDMQRSRALATKLASYFKIAGDLSPAEDRLQTTKEGTSGVDIIDASGAVFAADMGRLWATLPETRGDQLAPEKAAAQATAFLREMGLEVAQDAAVQARRDVVLISERDGQPKRVPGPMQVSVRPKLSGYPTVGGVEKAKVFFDESGAIAGCLVVRRALREEKSAELLPLQEAFKQLAEGGAMADLTLTRPDRIVIRQISLAYYGRAAAEEQAFVQPVYVFRGAALGGGRDGWRIPYEQYVAALKTPPEPIIAEPPPDSDEKIPGDMGKEGEEGYT